MFSSKSYFYDNGLLYDTQKLTDQVWFFKNEWIGLNVLFEKKIWQDYQIYINFVFLFLEP